MWWWLGVALAQTPPVADTNSQLYRPPVDSQQTLWTDDAGNIEDGLRGSARVYAQYVYRPFAWVDGNGDQVNVVSDVLELDLVPAVRFDRFRAGLHLPIYLLSTSEVAGNGAGLGDIALDLRGTILDSADAPIGLAATARAFYGTGTVAAPLATNGPGFELAGVVDTRIDQLLLAANIGTRFLPEAAMANVTLNDQIFARLGSGYALSDAGGLSLDMAGQANYSAPITNPSSLPIEVLGGGWFQAGPSTVRLGLGRGVTPGIGTPTARVVLSVSVGEEARSEPPPAREPREPKRETLDIEGKVYFESASAKLRPESHSKLDKVAKAMKGDPTIRRVRVEGHTDEEGTDDYNMDLSQRRAEAVVDYLVDKGVERERLQARGYGESRPISENMDDNRRVEFVIVERSRN